MQNVHNEFHAFGQCASLVETDWVEQHLHDPAVRIVECTVLVTSGSQGTYVESGVHSWEAGHIPGSCFIDLLHELSDSQSPFPFMLPSAAQFAAKMSQCGIDPQVRVVLYDRDNTVWAARLWWMLRYFGFDQAAILNGGWRKWVQEGRPVSDDLHQASPSTFTSHLRPELFVSKDAMKSVMGNACLVHTLHAESYCERRIPDSINVPAADLLDPETGALLPWEELRNIFHKKGMTGKTPIVTYCRAGITACLDAFVLMQLGYPAVSVYDGSLAEWTADPELPIETGDPL